MNDVWVFMAALLGACGLIYLLILIIEDARKGESND